MTRPKKSTFLDCAIAGGGPAGLTAALYLSRFGRNFMLIDSGASRARWIPESHNIPLFARGIAGGEILQRQRAHAELYGAKIASGEITSIAKTAPGFTLRFRQAGEGGETEEVNARFVLLATGVVDIEPNLAGVPEAVERGLLRYCPICDGYEAKDKKIAVIGRGSSGLGEAAFMAKTYGARITLLSLGEPLSLSEAERRRLSEERIEFVGEPIRTLTLTGAKIRAAGTNAAGGLEFDTVYSALGVQHRSGLAAALGASVDETGAVVAGTHGETSVPGLFAAGDLVQGLNQIVVAMGQAAMAATAIHNRL